jgi:hypothetical protein
VSDIIYQNQEIIANSTKGGFPVKGGKGNEGGNHKRKGGVKRKRKGKGKGIRRKSFRPLQIPFTF